MEESTSKFNINFVREVFLFGDEHHVTAIKKLIKGYYFLQPRAGKDLGPRRDEPHFVIVAADLTLPQKMQDLATLFAADESALAHRVIYVVQPDSLSREQLLCAQEIGVSYVFVGSLKAQELKDYLKRVCVEAHQVGPLAPYEEEIEVAYRHHDRPALGRILEKLKDLPAESEDGLRLLALTSMHVNDLRRAEVYLKRLLTLNPQNLWAANTLGKFFLREGRAAQGMEILQKLSHFHELNSERLLTLGNAQVVAGKTHDAEQNFLKGEKLTGGVDGRFKAGMAKVKLAENNFQGALDMLSDKVFSDDVISFLNTRAILAIRAGCFDEGINYYTYALKGAADEKDLKAKIMFNMGLAYIRTADLDRAHECFRESCALGGSRFQRAKGPLDKLTNVIKNRGKTKKTDAEAIKEMDSEDWETLY